MVTVKYEEMEAFCESMRALARQTEEVFELIWRLNNEISCDTDVLLLSQAQQVLRKLQNTVNYLMVADDMMQNLRAVSDFLPEGYRSLEENMCYCVRRVDDYVGYLQRAWEREIQEKSN